MPFWTVEDAGPYKEKSNFLMRTSLSTWTFWVRRTELQLPVCAMRIIVDESNVIMFVYEAIYQGVYPRDLGYLCPETIAVFD